LAWVAFKVGALSYGGRFVIILLMQHDGVTTFHWMTGSLVLECGGPRA
jgi:chromate transporter